MPDDVFAKIQESRRNFAMPTSAGVSEDMEHALDGMSGYATQSVPTGDEASTLTGFGAEETRSEMDLSTAFAIVRLLNENPIIKEFLEIAESRQKSYQAKGDDLKKSQDERSASRDRALGIKECLAIFTANLTEATERIRQSRTDERINLTSEEAATYERLTGRKAVPAVAAPQVTAASLIEPPTDAAQIRRNTEAAIAFFEAEKRRK